MITSQPGAEGVRVWVAVEPVDMRKGFDGLAEVVRAVSARRNQSCAA